MQVFLDYYRQSLWVAMAMLIETEFIGNDIKILINTWTKSVRMGKESAWTS